MAFNLSVFKTRALTAIIFVVVMLGGLLINKWLFVALCTIIACGCFYEMIKLIKKMPGSNLTLLPAAIVYTFLPILLFADLAFPAWNAVGSGFDPWRFSPLVPCVILASLWINDTMAYLVGSFIGKTPLTKISPKKTWEGTLGGIILSIVVVGFSLSYYISVHNISFTHQSKTLVNSMCFLLPAVCAVAGTLGDLLESKIKRMAGVKDSGKFMPGHGGFLDRFDSLLLAAPAAWLLLELFFI